MAQKLNYTEKFSRIAPATLYAHLDASQQQQVHEWATRFCFTQQELQQVCERLRDIQMWDEEWQGTWDAGLTDRFASASDPRQQKRQFLKRMDAHHQSLRERGPVFAPTAPPPVKAVIIPLTLDKEKLGLGTCPVASPKTRCCNLMTLDMVENCGFGCSYCSIQTFYGDREVRFDKGFADKLDKLELDPKRIYHIGTGQSSDSLMWGNSHGCLDALMKFAARHPNVILELKSKSANIGYLLKNDVPANVICTWSLNPQLVIDHEEHGTASLKQRLDAARQLADKGVLVGFHFHPMIRHEGWQDNYAAVTRQIQQQFTPAETALISIGTLTYIKPVIRKLRKEGRVSKILQMPMEEAAGKLSYPRSIKVEMFRSLYQSFDACWQDQVFFYLCMENPDLWQDTFGFEFPDNDAFEQAMLGGYKAKINQRRVAG